MLAFFICHTVFSTTRAGIPVASSPIETCAPLCAYVMNIHYAILLSHNMRQRSILCSLVLEHGIHLSWDHVHVMH
jgi:hypothetical protein